MFWKNAANLQENTHVEVWFIEFALWHGCSPVNLLYIFRTPFHNNTSSQLLLLYSNTAKSILYFLWVKHTRHDSKGNTRSVESVHICSSLLKLHVDCNTQCIYTRFIALLKILLSQYAEIFFLSFLHFTLTENIMNCFAVNPLPPLNVIWRSSVNKSNYEWPLRQ